MGKNKMLLAFLVGGAISVNAATLDQCQELAQSNYPLIRQYGLLENTSGYDVANVAKGYLPQVNAFAQATWQNHVTQYPEKFNQMMGQMGLDVKGLSKDQYKIGVDARQSIWDGGQIKARQNEIKAEYEADKENVAVGMYEVRKRVNDLYFGILLLESKAEQNDNLQELLNSNKERVASCVKNGVAMQCDLDLVQAEILNVKQQRISIDMANKTYRTMLGHLVGKSMDNEKLEMPEETLPSNSIADNRPEMRLFKAKREMLDSKKAGIKASLMPNVNAFAQTFYGKPGLDMFGAMFDNKWSFNFLVGVSVNWNIGGLYRKKINLAKIDEAKRQVDVEQETFLFNNKLKSTQEILGIDAKRKEIESDNEIIRLRESVRKASEAKLNNGVIVVSDLIRDINSENQAKIAKDVHNIELLQEMYNLKYTVNE